MKVSVIVELREPNLPAAIGVGQVTVETVKESHGRIAAKFWSAIGHAQRNLELLRREREEERKKQREIPFDVSRP